MTKDDKYVFSALRISLNAVITLVVAVVLLLINFFVIDGIDGAGKPHDTAYWIEKILGAVGTFLIMISVANITEDARKKRDKDYADRTEAIDKNYLYINENSLTEDIEFYILQKNITAKYLAHIRKWKRKLARAKKDEDKKKCELKLIMTPDEVWASPERIRFVKITYSQLVSGTTEINPAEDENDLSVHKGRLVLKKMLFKAVSIIGAGMYLPEITSHFQDFSKSDVLPLAMRVILILWACYSGVCFGYAIVDRILTVLKRKIKVFSEFHARSEKKTADRYIIDLPKDTQIEKLLKEYGVELSHAEKKHENEEKPHITAKETINEFVANPYPIMPTQLVKQIAKAHIADKAS